MFGYPGNPGNQYQAQKQYGGYPYGNKQYAREEAAGAPDQGGYDERSAGAQGQGQSRGGAPKQGRSVR